MSNHSMKRRKNFMLFLLLVISVVSYSQDKQYWWTGGNNDFTGTAPVLGTLNNLDVKIFTNNQNRWVFKSDGRLLQAGSTSLYNLGLYGADSVYTNYLAGPVLGLGSNRGFVVGMKKRKAIIKQIDNYSMLFYTNNIERLIITADGKVGVGNSTPTALLDVDGSLRFRSGANNGFVLKSDSQGYASWQELNDDNATNEIQALSLVGNELSLTKDATSIDLSIYLDNTDTQLTEAEVDAYVNNNGFLTNPNDADANPENEIQSLAIDGNQLSISGSNTVELEGLGFWNKTGANLDYLSGMVGVGVEPAALFHVHNDKYDLGNLGGGSKVDPIDLGGGDLPISQPSTTNFLLTNKNTGHTRGDGLSIQSAGQNGIFHLQEYGAIYLKIANENKLTIHRNGNVAINGLQGEGDYLVSVNSSGVLQSGNALSDFKNLWAENNDEVSYMNNVGIGITDPTVELDIVGQVKVSSLAGGEEGVVVANGEGLLSKTSTTSFGDDMGNCTATENLKMSNKAILNTSYISVEREHGNWLNLSTTDDKDWFFHNHYNDGKLRFAFDDANDHLPTNWNLLVLDGHTSNVGIGTSSPNAKLQVTSGEETKIAIFENDLSAKIEINGEVNRGLIRNMKRGKHLELGTRHTNGTYNDNQLFLDAKGNIGIGTNEPNSLLDVKITSNTTFKTYNYGTEITVNTTGGWARAMRFKNENNPDFAYEYGAVKGMLYLNANHYTASGNPLGYTDPDMVILDNGFVGIGKKDPSFKLDVAGVGRFCKVIVQQNGWCDYVFEEDYNLMSLYDLNIFIKKNKHLPDIPTAKDVEENDINLGEMNKLLLKKVEELTLYIIEQNKRIEKIEQQLSK